MMKFDDTTLWVKTINGRYGPFNVADLDTAIGRFRIKDQILDQFEEGKYAATAWIEELTISNYIAYGRSVSEIRARLHDIQVLDESQEPVPQEQSEPDPIEEEISHLPAPLAEPQETPETMSPDQGSQPEAANPHDDADGADEFAPDADDGVFDEDTLEAIAQHEAIKLDPTIERVIFRQQTHELKARGYRFDAREQIWYWPEAEAVI